MVAYEVDADGAVVILSVELFSTGGTAGISSELLVLHWQLSPQWQADLAEHLSEQQEDFCWQQEQASETLTADGSI